VRFTLSPVETERNRGRHVGYTLPPFETEKKRGQQVLPPFGTKRIGDGVCRPRSKQKEKTRGRLVAANEIIHSSVYFTLPPLFRWIPTDFHRTQPIPTDPADSPSDFQRNPSDLTKFRCLSGPSPVKVR
jgi:hypothetical protein